LIHSRRDSLSLVLSGSSPSIRMSHSCAWRSIEVRAPNSTTFPTTPPVLAPLAPPRRRCSVVSRFYPARSGHTELRPSSGASRQYSRQSRVLPQFLCAKGPEPCAADRPHGIVGRVLPQP